MAFEKKVPEWLAAGSEPPASLKQSGFTPGYKPPADYFNWFWSSVSAVLAELQEKAFELGGDAVVPTTKGGTGAKSAEEGFKTLLTRATINATNLVNANTLTTSGVHMIYLEGSAVPTPSDYNYPANYGVLSVVNAGGYITQTFYCVSADTVYYRSSYNVGGNWGDWKKIYTDKNLTLTDLGGILSVEHGGTGAYNVNGAVRNLLCKMLINDTSIVNANTLTSTGIHKVYVTDETIAQNNNYPYVYGNLVVISNMEETSYAYIMQMFLTTDGKIYLRASTNSGSTWTEWVQFYNANSKVDADTVDGIHVQTTPGNSGLKCIYATTADLTAGTSALATGTICLVYE